MKVERSLRVWVPVGLVYATSAASAYFALGVIVRYAGGLTPLVFIVAGLFFQLTAMTYAEGASRHHERGGAAAFARKAFGEPASFIASWSVTLNYTLLLTLTALAVPAYLAVFWGSLSHGTAEVLIAFAAIAIVAVDNVIGVDARRLRRRMLVTVIDLLLQGVFVVLGLILIVHPHHLTETVHLGSAPSVSDLGFALPISVIAFAGLESSATVTREVAASIRDIHRLVRTGAIAAVIVYIGIAVVGIGGMAVHGGISQLGESGIRAPMVAIAEAFHPHWLAVALKYIAAIGGVIVLLTVGDLAMLGVARSGYRMATTRQIPAVIGRISRRWSTPWIVIVCAALAGAALTLPRNPSMLLGIYAFGALLAYLIAHLSVIRMRVSDEDENPGGYRAPLTLNLRGTALPLPAIFGALLALLGLLAVVIVRTEALYVGCGWLLLGLLLYGGYRAYEHRPPLRRAAVSEQVSRSGQEEQEYGSILVPVFGGAMDDEIVQTAGRLAGAKSDDSSRKGATIEALSVIEVPMSLPLDAPLPQAQVDAARAALARAKAVGEEYEGVEVATAIVRGRRAGEVIVREAKRRGVEVIVLAADESGVVRGGPRLGALLPLENFIGAVTRYVISKAPCRVILTAPPLEGADMPEKPATSSREIPGDSGAGDRDAGGDGAETESHG